MEQLNQEPSPFAPEDNTDQQEQTPETSAADAPEPAGEPAEPALQSAAPAGNAQADAPTGGEGEFADKVITCAQCGAEFVHTASAQAFYKEKGFANEPKNCAPCRKARKSQGGYSSRGGGGRGGPREMFPATCADCGKETQVPFKPSGARPVYCLDCYRKQRGS